MIEDKAKRLGALECHVVDARERFADEFVAAGDQGQRALRRRLPALHRAGPAADRQARRRVRAAQRLRHDRPRLHRQGQRPGPDRGDGGDARAGAEDDRAGALLADGPRGGDRLRARARHPGQGRHRGGALLDRRQPLGPLLGGALDRGPRPRARGRRLPARHPARGGAGRGRDGDGRVRGRRAGRPRRRAARPGRAARARRRDRLPPRRRDRRPHRGPHRRPQGARHLRGAGGGDPAARAPGAGEAGLHDPPEPVQAGARPQVGLPRLRRALVGAAARRPRRLHGGGQRPGDRHDRAEALQGQRRGSSPAPRPTRSTTPTSPPSPSRAGSSRRPPRPASSSSGRCSRGWRTGSASAAREE